MKNDVFWDVTPYVSLKNRRFGGRLFLTKATQHNIPEDAILYNPVNLALDVHNSFNAMNDIAR
jgi:hypothetical protein